MLLLRYTLYLNVEDPIQAEKMMKCRLPALLNHSNLYLSFLYSIEFCALAIYSLKWNAVFRHVHSISVFCS